MIFCRRVFVVFLGVTNFFFFSLETLHAAISSLGDVSPVPPVDGGSVSNPRIGITSLGKMDITGGTTLSSSGSAVVGDGTNGIGVVTMSGFGSNWTFSSSGGDLAVGVDGTGLVTVSDLARMDVADDTILGDDPTGTGQINIIDLGSVWDTSNLIVGSAGLGIANINAGGQLVSGTSVLGTSIGSEGRVTIADVLSFWRVSGGITVGAAGRASISILDGGMLRTTAVSTIGDAVGSVGTIEVNGVGSLWNSVNSGIVLGETGTGKLNVFNGGHVSMEQTLSLAVDTGSRGTIWVDGLGSTLAAPQISSGAGEAEITVSNGGLISASTLNWGPTGRISLDGGRLEGLQQGSTNRGLIHGDGVIDAASFNNSGEGSSRGRLLVRNDEHLLLTGSLTNVGLVDVDGGELEVAGTTINNFDIGIRSRAILRFGGTQGPGLDNNNGAQLVVSAGEVDVFGTVRNNSGGQIFVGNSASVIFHDSVTNNGSIVVSPGATLLAVEQLNLLGGLSTLSIGLAEKNLTEGKFPVQSAGPLIIEGNLEVTLADGYQPQAGDVLPLLFSGSSLAGVFSNEDLPSLGTGLAWDVMRTTESLSLLVVESDAGGDFDNDGDVDGRDFLVWQRGGSPSPLSAGDLADWQAQYGAGPLVAASTSVPEPGNGWLLGVGLIYYRLSARQRRK